MKTDYTAVYATATMKAVKALVEHYGLPKKEAFDIAAKVYEKAIHQAIEDLEK